MAVYNEYRPMTLKEVKGQTVIKNQLKAIFEAGSVPQALLFTGPRGTGKTTIARIVARFVNCEDPHGDPCNECSSCKEIIAGRSPDVLELDAASNNGVADVRSLIEQAQYTPVGKKKVFILDECHMLSGGAWNALLKILEEPPKTVVFILCTTEEQKIPATIVSRCRKFLFERVDLTEIVSLMEDVCEDKGKCYDKDALLMIARASEGCVRDALSILESFLDVDAVVTETVAKTLGLSGEDVIFNILEGVEKGDAVSAVSSLKQAESRGINLSALIKSLIGALSDALFIKQGADIDTVLNTATYKERLKGFVPCLTTGRCVELIGELSNIYGSISKTPDASFLLEASLLKAIQTQTEIGALRDRVSQLEKAVALGIKPVDVAEKTVAVNEEPSEPENVSVDADDAPAETKDGNEDMAAPVISSVDGFEDADDVCPFDEDPEPDVFGEPAMQDNAESIAENAAAPVAIQEETEQSEPEVPTGAVNDPDEELPTMADLYADAMEGFEIGDSVDLFGDDSKGDASAPTAGVKEEPAEKPEEAAAYKKQGAEAPVVDVAGLSGFLWQ